MQTMNMVMAYIVMAYTVIGGIPSFYTVMAYGATAGMVVANIVMAQIVVAYIDMA